jgi:hypothetical protein
LAQPVNAIGRISAFQLFSEFWLVSLGPANHKLWREQNQKTATIAIRARFVPLWNASLISLIAASAYGTKLINHSHEFVKISGVWIPRQLILGSFALGPELQNLQNCQGTKTESGKRSDSGVVRSWLNPIPNAQPQIGTRLNSKLGIINLKLKSLLA